MSKRLVIDLNQCADCDECTVQCADFYGADPTEHGILALRELAAFALVCRRCENPSCVAGCRFDALERQADGLLRRYNLRCVACKSCVQACPFGTIDPATIRFYAVSCDLCHSVGDSAEPACVETCERNAIQFRYVPDSGEDGVYVVNENLAVLAPRWEKEDV